jgi:hypothetical protein
MPQFCAYMQAPHCVVPWQMNSILIIGIIAPYMYSILRFFRADTKVQTGCKITVQAPSKPVSTRFPTFSWWSAPAHEQYSDHLLHNLLNLIISHIFRLISFYPAQLPHTHDPKNICKSSKLVVKIFLSILKALILLTLVT